MKSEERILVKGIFAFVCLFLCSFFVAQVQAEAQGLYFYAAQTSDPEPVAAGNTVRYYPDTDVFKLTGFDNEIYVVRNAKDLHVMCEAITCLSSLLCNKETLL